ncbi:hypothetical protein ACU4GD_23365 [Cupriavidus basilensis]
MSGAITEAITELHAIHGRAPQRSSSCASVQPRRGSLSVRPGGVRRRRQSLLVAGGLVGYGGARSWACARA